MREDRLCYIQFEAPVPLSGLIRIRIEVLKRKQRGKAALKPSTSGQLEANMSESQQETLRKTGEQLCADLNRTRPLGFLLAILEDEYSHCDCFCLKV